MLIPKPCGFHHSYLHSYLSQPNRDVYSRRQVEPSQGVYGFGSGFQYVYEPLMGAYFEVLPRIFVYVRASNNAETANVRRQRHRPSHPGAGPLRSLDDLAGGQVQHLMVECFEYYSYFLLGDHPVLPQPSDSYATLTSDFVTLSDTGS
jgi:hypothetical protein